MSLDGDSAFAARSMMRLGERIKNATARASAVTSSLQDTATPTLNYAISPTAQTCTAASNREKSWCAKEKLYIGLAIGAVILVGGVAIAFSIVALKKSDAEAQVAARATLAAQALPGSNEALSMDASVNHDTAIQAQQEQALLSQQLEIAPQRTVSGSSVAPRDEYNQLPKRVHFSGDNIVNYMEYDNTPSATGGMSEPAVNYASADDIQLPSMPANMTLEGQIPEQTQIMPNEHVPDHEMFFPTSATGAGLAEGGVSSRGASPTHMQMPRTVEGNQNNNNAHGHSPDAGFLSPIPMAQ